MTILLRCFTHFDLDSVLSHVVFVLEETVFHLFVSCLLLSNWHYLRYFWWNYFLNNFNMFDSLSRRGWRFGIRHHWQHYQKRMYIFWWYVLNNSLYITFTWDDNQFPFLTTFYIIFLRPFYLSTCLLSFECSVTFQLVSLSF